MKGLVKGILAIGTAIVVGCVIYKKVKEDKQNKEEVIIEEETQELTKEQQEIYNEVCAQVMKEMKPISRANTIRRFMIVFGISMFYIFMHYNISVEYKNKPIFEYNLKKDDVA